MTKSKIEFPKKVDLEEKISEWAHDLRSPFNHVLGFTKMVLNGQSGPLTDLQKEDLTTAYRSALRAMSQVNNLIEIARLQRGEKDVSRAPLELQTFLDQTIAQWQKNNLGVEMPIATLLAVQSPTVELDKQQTGWILNSFFSYLAAYSDGTGSLTLEISEEINALIFTLRQTGITKPGFDEMTKEMSAHICRAYIDLQGGKIRQSELDETEAMIQFMLPK
ncbi:MAG: HAMP domain-containing histidine kinase [Anaerolineales bacterium]|nr:HAMP domain-containing histidine kinase [Anaerolineales bacterium]